MTPRLSKDLREMGYSRTEQESPFDEDGTLWSKGYEVVCDETGIVIRSDSPFQGEDSSDDKTVYRYRNSEKIKMIGGHVSNYEWGSDESGTFTYEQRK